MGQEAQRRNAAIGGIPMKYISLVTLTFQNSALILIMRYSQTMPPPDGHRYFNSTAVFLNEVIKLIMSFAMSLYETRAGNPGASLPTLLSTVSKTIVTRDSWKLAIPAGLYTLQNTLQYVAVRYLDAATFQVTYQLKILTTALFSVTMLKRSLSVKKWVSLVLLMVGVAVVQFPVKSDAPASSGPNAGAPPVPPPGTAPAGVAAVADERRSLWARADPVQPGEDHQTYGLVAVIIACAISGLAGVYFEKVLKDNNVQVSLWVRNVQLSFYSIFFAGFVGCWMKDGQAIAKDGFFAGYNWVVWLAISFQAFGGLIVALVVNYADNIAKNFATSISIIISLLVSVWLFSFNITINFLIGMLVVLYATFLYSSPDRKPAEQDRVVNSEERGEHEEAQEGEQVPFMADKAEPPRSPTLRSPRASVKDG